MNEQMIYYFIAAILVTFYVLRFMKNQTIKKRLSSILKQGAIIIDVRSGAEFAAGACPGSLNVPLEQLERKIKSFDKETAYIVCCASGARSRMAESIFRRHGFTHVLNAGSWTNAIV